MLPQPSQVTSDQVRPIDALQRLGDAMPVTSPRFTLEARQCHALAGSHPPSDFFESRALERETFTFILGKQCIVIGLSMRFVSLLRRNAQLRQMFIADSDAFARMRQCTFGKPYLRLSGLRRTSQSNVAPLHSNSLR